MEAMLHELMTAGALATLALLVGLELVLGIDNILVISLVVSRLPEAERKRARMLGLVIALVMRLVFVAFAFKLVHLTDPIFHVPTFNEKFPLHPVSIKDLVLLVGGLFLIYKAVNEINHVVTLKDEGPHISAKNAVSAAIMQIVLLDIVFSVDSVITAVGLTQNLITISLAVILSFVGLLFYAGPIGEFILRHTALKILALSFLVTIGVTLCLEGMHKHVDKGYIYLPMGFALLVELLQMRYIANAQRAKKSEE
ncbi:MAG TPA: TerC family protein [Chthoniobacterales bacterium]|nr:TerC family protein [Chthoniobacterales bacterium]